MYTAVATEPPTGNATVVAPCTETRIITGDQQLPAAATAGSAMHNLLEECVRSRVLPSPDAGWSYAHTWTLFPSSQRCPTVAGVSPIGTGMLPARAPNECNAQM